MWGGVLVMAVRVMPVSEPLQDFVLLMIMLQSVQLMHNALSALARAGSVLQMPFWLYLPQGNLPALAAPVMNCS